MAQSSSALSSVASATILNLMGIFVSIVLTILFLILGAHAMKYIKTFAVKIKVIVNRAEDKKVSVKDFNYEHKRDDLYKNHNFLRMEEVFKNEIKRSRSPLFFSILGSYMSKYNQLVYYPFRNRVYDKIDLLKPKTSFFLMMFVCTLCIVWMSTVLLASLFTQFYSDITSLSAEQLVLLGLAISIVSSVLSLIAINRFYALYLLNIKNSFKVDYGNRFTRLDKGLKEFELENEQELKAWNGVQEVIDRRKQKYEAEQDGYEGQDKIRNSILNSTGRYRNREESQSMSSTRKLMPEDFERSNNRDRRLMPNIIREVEDEDAESNLHQAYGSGGSYAKSNYGSNPIMNKMQHNIQKHPKKRLKDIFGLQVDIEGVADADPDEKYVYIEDTHAIGDLDLLNNEAGKGENSSNVVTFLVMFGVIGIAAVACCYLNYQFSNAISKDVFFLFVGAFVVDLLIFRIFFLVLISMFKVCKAHAEGYKDREHRNNGEIVNLLGQTFKQMQHNKQKDQLQRKITVLNNASLTKSKSKLLSLDNQTYQGDQYDTSMKGQYPNEEGKEDDFAQEVVSNFYTRKAEEDGEREKSQDFITNDPFLNKDSSLQAQHTHDPLMTQIIKGIQQRVDDKHADIMEQKQIADELVDYNLMLLRKIYDAYEERADKVLKQFRSDKHNVLRKRYMTPIVNPNYDFEKLLREIRETQKLKDEVEEESVHMDGETVGEDQDLQMIEAIIEEEAEDVSCKETPNENRVQIDKFGNKIDPTRQDQTLQLPLPAKGIIPYEKEEEMVEDDADEWSRKMKELAYLRAKKKKEGLNEEEEKRLIELEREEDLHRHRLIDQLQKKDKLTEQESEELKSLMQEEEEYRGRRINDLEEKKEKSGLCEEEEDELKMLKQWQEDQKRKLLEELRQKLKNGTLTDEERRLLQQLEEEDWQKKKRELDLLRQKLLNGIELTEEEKRRLLELEEEEERRMWSELEELRRKLRDGTITDEERIRLQELEEWAKTMKKRELEELRRKQRNGQLTEEELRRLQQLEEEERLINLKLLELREEQRLKELQELIDEFMGRGEENLTDEERLKLLQWQREKAQIELERMRRSENTEDEELMQQEITIERLDYEILMLKKKLGLLSEEEALRLAELEAKFKMDENSVIEKNEEFNNEEEAIKEVELLEESQNPFEQQNMLQSEQVQSQHQYQQDNEGEGEDERESYAHSRITEEDNFVNLPPVELMNKTQSRVGTAQKTQRESQREQMLRQQQLDEEERDQVLDLQQQQENRPNTVKSQARTKPLMNEIERGMTAQSLYGGDGDNVLTPKSALKSQQLQNERVNTAKSGVRFKDLEQQQQEEENEGEGSGEMERLGEEGDQDLNENGEIINEDGSRSRKSGMSQKQMEQERLKSAMSQQNRVMTPLNEEQAHAMSQLSQSQKQSELNKNKSQRINLSNSFINIGSQRDQQQEELLDQEQLNEEQLRNKSAHSLRSQELQKSLRSQQNQQEDQQDLYNQEQLNEGDQELNERELSQRMQSAKSKARSIRNEEEAAREELRSQSEENREREKMMSAQSKLRSVQDQEREEQERIMSAQSRLQSEKSKLKQLQDDMLTEKQKQEELERIMSARSQLRSQQRTQSQQEQQRMLTEQEIQDQLEKEQQELNERIMSAKSKQRSERNQEEVERLRREEEEQLQNERLMSAKSKQRSQLQSRQSQQNQQQYQDEQQYQQNESDEDYVDRNLLSAQSERRSDYNIQQEEQYNEQEGVDPSERLLSAKNKSQLSQKQLSELQRQQQLQQQQEEEEELQQRLQEELEQQQRQRSQLEQYQSDQDQQRLLSSQSRPLSQLTQQELKRLQQQQEEQEEAERLMSAQRRADQIKSRQSNQQQQMTPSNQRQGKNEDEQFQRENMLSGGGRMPSELENEFNDELEFREPPGPAAMEQDESIYSHKTSTILDEEKVSFMHIEQLPHQDNASDDSFSEQDMVYYNKDDMTNYSKHMNLNRVKAKELPAPKQQYYSENDIQEMNEGRSDSENSTYTMDENGRRVKRQRDPIGRGKIKHNQLEIQSYDDDIDGRVKVDSWNLNYNKKKHRLKKKKLDQATKNKMNDLQNIYGVDARTLAGLQKGHYAKKGGGKKGDGQSDGMGASRYSSDNNGFRSTQHSFLKGSQVGRGLNALNGEDTVKKSVDGQSNMFSFGGQRSVMSKRWNDIESTLKGNRFGGDRGTANKDNKLNASGLRNKLTSTQQNFKGGQQQRRNGGMQGSGMEEERKSDGRNSRSNSNNNRGGAMSMGNNNRSGFGGKGKDNKGNNNGKNNNKGNVKQGKGARGYDSYSESDEGVNDQDNLFQKRGGPKPKGGDFRGGMNDEYLEHHSESDEGVNDGRAAFDENNQFVFKKRQGGAAGGRDNSNGKGKQGSSNNQRNNSKKGGTQVQKFRGSDTEDLEAQAVTTTKKGRNLNMNSDDEEGVFGGRVNFNQNNQIGNMSNQRGGNNNQRIQSLSDASDFEVKGKRRGPSNQNSGIKPPMTGSLAQQNNRSRPQGQTQTSFNNSQHRLGGQAKAANYADSDTESARNRVSGYKRGQNQGSAQSNGQRRNRQQRNNQGEDDDDSYLVGPESNHSMIRSRVGGERNNNRNGSEDDKYLLLHRQSQQIEDLEAEGGTEFAKKRRVKKAAAHSNEVRDRNLRQLENQRNLRLKQKQVQAERHANSDGESQVQYNMSKMKQKKQQKETVRKEINYWLDYDSPYAEYLVARFREYSPNVRGPQARSASSRQQSQASHRYNEVQNTYNRDSRMMRSGSKPQQQVEASHSRSNSKQRKLGRNEASNSKRGGKNEQQKESAQKRKMNNKSDNENNVPRPFQGRQVNNLFVEDFEEP